MNSSLPDVAVILARGLGTRMRRAGPELDAATDAVAGAGLKALIPVGRPFLDHVIGEVAEAGFRDVILVIGPEHEPLRAYCRATRTTRVRLSTAVQEEPRGTANAVLSAAAAVGDRRFLVINADNHYPSAALAALRRVPGAGLVGFARAGLLRGGIAAEQLAAFAIAEPGSDGRLVRIIEKPAAAVLSAHPDWPVSMNCWLFTPSIFAACASIGLSPRGEYELPDAVTASMAAGVGYAIVPADVTVFDLSRRSDIAGVRAHLAGSDPVL